MGRGLRGIPEDVRAADRVIPPRALVLRLAAAGLWLAAAAAPAAPRIACDDPVLRFGRVSAEKETIDHAFVLRNAGNETLELLGVDEFCGCTDIRLDHRVLMPGSSTRLRVRVSLRGRTGTFDKHLFVRSNDPATPRLRLGFVGEIDPVVEVLPAAALFGAVPADRSVTQSVEVVFSTNRPNRVVRVRPDAPWIGAAMAEVEPNRRYRVDIWTVPPLKADTPWMRGNVVAETTDRTMPKVFIGASAVQLTDLIVGPAEIVMFASDTPPLTRYAMVRPGRIRTFKIEAVETPDPAIRTEVRWMADGTAQIVLDGVRPSKALDGAVLVIRTDVRPGGVYRIPFRVIEDRK